MTVTTAETLSVNGVVLNTLAKNIESLTGRLRVADLRTPNITVPGRHGSLRTVQKFYNEGQIILPMWVRGTDDDGNVANRTLFYSNVDALSRIFRPGSGMLEVLHTHADGSIRRAWAECTEAIDFSVVSKSGQMPLGKFSVALTVPEVFWEEQNLQTFDVSISLNGAVTQLTGMTAPIEDGIFTITGPATNPKIEALYNGVSMETPTWFQYSGTVASAQTLIVNCDTWTLTGTGGMTVNYANFSHVGGSRWLTVVPGPPGVDPGLKVTASSTTGASKVTVAARRKYLVG